MVHGQCQPTSEGIHTTTARRKAPILQCLHCGASGLSLRVIDRCGGKNYTGFVSQRSTITRMTDVIANTGPLSSGPLAPPTPRASGIHSRTDLWHRPQLVPAPIPPTRTSGPGPLTVRFVLTGAHSSSTVAFEIERPAAQHLPAPAHSDDQYEETIYGIGGVLTWTRSLAGPFPRGQYNVGTALRRRHHRRLAMRAHKRAERADGSPAKIRTSLRSCPVRLHCLGRAFWRRLRTARVFQSRKPLPGRRRRCQRRRQSLRRY